ncbi:hypothetical protein LTR56_006175 [Elasticomyces elasticus]|nr:hypothetical protein LTR56_006175 [Elasticomyces elasticus]
MSSPFHFGESTSRRDTWEEEASSESNFEHMCPANGDENPTVVHSWFGKLSFAHRLAESIIKEVGAHTTGDELDTSDAMFITKKSTY